MVQNLTPVDAVTQAVVKPLQNAEANPADIAKFHQIAGASGADVYVSSNTPSSAPYSIDGLSKHLVSLSATMSNTINPQLPKIAEGSDPMVAQMQVINYTTQYLTVMGLQFNFAVKTIETIQKSFETLYKLQG
jgi:hypothetical protein